MAKITDLESIIDKIKDFDSYLDQSIDAAKALSDSKSRFEQCEKDLKLKVESFDAQQSNFHDIMEKSSRELVSIENKSSEIFDFISKEKNALLETEKKLNAAIQNLTTEVTNQLDKQCDSLVHEMDTKYADVRKAIMNIVAKAEQMILVFEGKLAEQDEKIGIEFKEIHTQVDALFSLKQTEFNELINKKHNEIQEDVESNHSKLNNQITEFLHKQNTLVDNLNIQIKSYHGVTDSLKQEIAKQNKAIEDLALGYQKEKREIEFLNESLKLHQQKISKVENENRKIIAFLNKIEITHLGLLKIKK